MRFPLLEQCFSLEDQVRTISASEDLMRRYLFTCLATALLGGAACGQAQPQIPPRLSTAVSFLATNGIVATRKDAGAVSPGAVSMLELSAISGDPIAQNNLGYLYSSGQGVPLVDEMAE